MGNKKLIDMAKETLKNAYAPYSNFHVGAALITDSGKIYTGVNVENASYGGTICAERVAVVKAISEGERKIKAIAIASSGENLILPCGFCRQVLAEFGEENLIILCTSKSGELKEFTLKELLPYSFTTIG